MNNMNPEDENTKSFEIITSDTIIEHYRIINLIGSGGMGEVYLAEDTKLNRQVAIKFLAAHLSSNTDYKIRFIREAQAAAALNHPHIIHIHEVSEYQDRPFFVMELIEGKSLREIIKDDKLNFEGIIKLFIRICDGLIQAHKAGIIHRDIKTSNILVDSDRRPRILDFGLAIVESSDKITKSGITMGTIAYMSPEQTDGIRIDNRSDIFSLGIVLYEIITLQHPFKKDNIPATIKAIQEHNPEPLAKFKSDAPEGLQQIVNKALDKDRETRYQNIEDMQVDLKRILREMGVDSNSSKISQLKKSYTKQILVIIGLAFVMLIISSLIINPILLQKVKVWVGIDEPVPKAKHLVVLPLINLGNFENNQTFCDGLMEIFTSKLTQLEQFQGSLWVIPASEVRKRDISSAKEARKTFGANLAVTGSVQRYDENIRVTLNLVDTQTERQIRSSIMDYPILNVKALQDSTVLCLARMLEVELLPDEQELIFAGGTTDPDAYEYYIQGLGHLQKYHVLPDLPNVDTAITLFSKAINADTTYALAYAGLGEAFRTKYLITGEPEWIEEAKYNCLYAIEMNDKFAQVHIALGKVYYGIGENKLALVEFNKAIAIEPNNYSAHRSLARTYIRLNNDKEAEKELNILVELKPNYWRSHYSLGTYYYRTDRNEDAIGVLRKVENLLPEDYQANNNVGGLYYALNRWDDAKKSWSKSLKIMPNYAAYSNLGSLFSLERNYLEAIVMYDSALMLDDKDYRVWGNIAAAYGWLNNRKKADEYYHKAIEYANVKKSVNPNNPEIIIELAQYYTSINMNDSTMSLLHSVLDTEPEDLNIIFRIGLVFEQLNKRDSALIYIIKALNKGYSLNEVNSLPELDKLREDVKYIDFVNNLSLNP